MHNTGKASRNQKRNSYDKMFVTDKKRKYF
jgi:hypothetical protein